MTRPTMTDRQRTSFDEWWRGLSIKGDPQRRMWLTEEAFLAGFANAMYTRASVPADPRISELEAALRELLRWRPVVDLAAPQLGGFQTACFAAEATLAARAPSPAAPHPSEEAAS